MGSWSKTTAHGTEKKGYSKVPSETTNKTLLVIGGWKKSKGELQMWPVGFFFFLVWGAGTIKLHQCETQQEGKACGYVAPCIIIQPIGVNSSPVLSWNFTDRVKVWEWATQSETVEVMATTYQEVKNNKENGWEDISRNNSVWRTEKEREEGNRNDWERREEPEGKVLRREITPMSKASEESSSHRIL